MNASETLEVIKMLHAVGASHFKSHDFEIKLGGSSGSLASPIPSAKEEDSAPVNEAATEKLKGLIETLKLDDGQLLDKIFPAGAGG